MTTTCAVLDCEYSGQTRCPDHKDSLVDPVRLDISLLCCAVPPLLDIKSTFGLFQSLYLFQFWGDKG